MRVVLTGRSQRGRRTNSLAKWGLAPTWPQLKHPETHLEIGAEKGDRSYPGELSFTLVQFSGGRSEEASGEIDHKYRYEIARREGKGLPDHVTRGFYNFSAYLQAAALQAEYLCKEVESISAEKRPPRRRAKTTAPTAPPSPETNGSTAEAAPARPRETATLTVEGVLEDKTGCHPTERLAAYVKSRLWAYGLGYVGRENVLAERVLSGDIVSKFREIYGGHGHRKPFQGPSWDIDVINLVNFGLAHLNQPASFAEQGLIAILNKRFA